MIRLNLTNQPGLQLIDESEQFDPEGLAPDEIIESPESPGASAPKATQPSAPPEPESVPVPDIDNFPDMPLEPELPADKAPMDFDDDLFKLAEANLDLIEQAEEEEAGIGKTVKEAKLPEKKAKKKRNLPPMFRYIVLLAVIILIFVILMIYRNGKLNREAIQRAAQQTAGEVTREVSRKAEDVVRSADQLTGEYSEKVADIASQMPDAQRQLTTQAGQVAQQMSGGLSQAQQQIASRVSDVSRPSQVVRRSYGASTISKDLIRRLQIGQDKLYMTADILSQFPSSAGLQYLRIKGDKLSFIINVSSEAVAERIRNYFTSQGRFQNPEIFFVERTDNNPANPVEIMAIIRFQSMVSNDTDGYKCLSDRQLSQYIWQASLNSAARVNPLKISNADYTKIRDAEIAGNGGMENVIALLREIAAQRHNMSAKMISIKSDTNRPIRESVLNFNVNTIIYPGNM